MYRTEQSPDSTLSCICVLCNHPADELIIITQSVKPLEQQVIGGLCCFSDKRLHLCGSACIIVITNREVVCVGMTVLPV